MTVATEHEFDILRPLTRLSAITAGAPAYYRGLIEDADEYVRVGARIQLLSMDSVVIDDWPAIVSQCCYASIRALAVEHFEKIFEHGLARRAAETVAPQSDDIRRSGMLARLDLDQEAVARTEGQMYLATGNAKYLIAAAEASEAAEGWRKALPWLLRHLTLSPLDSAAAGMLLLNLAHAREGNLLEDYLLTLERLDLHAHLLPFGRAYLASIRKDNEACLKELAPLTDRAVAATANLAPLLQWLKSLRAETLDRLGQYQDSHNEYVVLNSLNRDSKFNPAEFYAHVEARSAVRIPPLPEDPRKDVFQMLGFPRSGTTLLENALNAHPGIETFEEIPSHEAAVSYIFRVPRRQTPPPASPVELFVEARQRYYQELDRRRRNHLARVLVDKLPMQSADARFIARLFPERRYIFSIRHPFDVVLSCFRQQFAPNLTMENFRTIADSVRLYDFTMSEWFGVFTLDSPQVLYVRYEDLVTEFEPTIRRTLGFLSLPWDDAVLEFAARAEQRSAKTPSYQKVRQGLSIGVQTYWRNYGFVFQTPEAEPLHKWARFFGYPTS